MSSDGPLSGTRVTVLVPHTPESVGYDSGTHFLSTATYHADYCRMLTELDAETELVYLSDDSAPSLKTNFDVRTVPVTSGSTYGKEFSLPLYRLLAVSESDIVHVQGYNQINILPVLVALTLSDTRVVLQNHGSSLDYSSIKYRLWYRLVRYLSTSVDTILSVDRAELENLRKAGIPSSKLVHLPNAVDTDLFHPIEKRDCRVELGLEDDKRYLLFVGKITENKGLTHLLRALPKIPDTVHLLVIYSSTDDEEMRRVEDIVSKNQLRDRTSFIGEVDHGELATYYNAADICVFPSVNEGFGVVTLEAMACGTPVIGTTEHLGGGHLKNRENALIAETASADALATNVIELLDDDELYDRLRERGITTVREEYSRERIKEIVVSVYRS